MNQSSEFYTLRSIAHIRSDFPEKFGIPRQPGLVPGLTAEIVLDPPFNDPDALRRITEFSHIWLIWGFSRNALDMTEEPFSFSPLITPPRLGGKEKVGVFASRSPYRPNSLGLSSVRLLGVSGTTLLVEGADLADGTPIYDIKPYVPYSDAHPDAAGGFAVPEAKTLRVSFPPELLERVPDEKKAPLLSLLAQDPRGAYEKQPGYVYGLAFAGMDIRFTVADDLLTVFDVVPADPSKHVK